MEKSDDDFYLLFVILANYSNNSAGFSYYSKKIIPALKKQPAMVRLFGSMHPAVVNGLPTAAFECDRHKLDSAVKSIARAIYYYHYQQKWTSAIDVLCPDIFMLASEQANEYNAGMKEFAHQTEVGLQRLQRIGNNPEIFYFQIHRERNRSAFVLRMVFYGGFVAIAVGTSSSGETNPIP